MDRQDYELPGAFYLGKTYNPSTRSVEEALVLYDSKDLCTHGVVLGMTGSGKTGLCIALIEEALLDNVPCLVIDPKGDISNLALTFPTLSAAEFEPWVSPEEAQSKGMSLEGLAIQESDKWRKGLRDWGQGPERVQSLREKGKVRIYTPGSDAGLPLSVLSSLKAPSPKVRDSLELFSDRIEACASGLLALVGIEARPTQSPEHVLLSQILQHHWTQNRDLDLTTLIRQIHTPAFQKVGILDIESFLPQAKRSQLALRFNNLIAAPSFAAWMQGEALDIQRLLYTTDGKPQIAVLSIAHLSDAERMFFVSLALNELISWMREQTGTNSLRALLYMDEVYGYLPPTANPPSKKPLMTLLKQARAYGLGVLLATQNPVDLDYKALSNIGTWFLGRLQTEQDKARVLEGLQTLSHGQGDTPSPDWEKLISALDKRVFVLHNVHEAHPQLIHVRWAMSYLAGPLRREQIRSLMEDEKESSPTITLNTHSPKQSNLDPPLLPPRVHQYFIPVADPNGEDPIVYMPAILRAAHVIYQDSKIDLDTEQYICELARIRQSSHSPQWGQAITTSLSIKDLEEKGIKKAQFSALPSFASDIQTYTQQKKDFVQEIYQKRPLTLFQSTSTGATSTPSEDQASFRQRLHQVAREVRDQKVQDLRDKYEKKLLKLEKKLETALGRVTKEESEASQSKLSAVISLGTSLLGAFLGGRSRSISAGGAAMKGVARSWKQSQDVNQAQAKVDRIREEILHLEKELQEEIEEVRNEVDPSDETFTTLKVPAMKRNIHVDEVALAWLPYYQLSEYELEPAWPETCGLIAPHKP